MGILSDVAGAIKQKARELYGALTAAVFRDAEKALEEPEAQPEQPKIVEVASSEKEIEQFQSDIANVTDMRQRGVIDERTYHSSLIQIGHMAFNRMQAYQNIVRQVEETTGQRIGQVVAERSAQQLEEAIVYQVSVNIIIRYLFRGVPTTDSRTEFFRGTKEQIMADIHARMEILRDSSPYKFGSPSVSYELLSEFKAVSRSLEYYNEGEEYSGGNYEGY